MTKPYNKDVPYYVKEWMSPEEWVSQGHCLTLDEILDSVVIHAAQSRRRGDWQWRMALWCWEAAAITHRR